MKEERKRSENRRSKSALHGGGIFVASYPPTHTFPNHFVLSIKECNLIMDLFPNLTLKKVSFFPSPFFDPISRFFFLLSLLYNLIRRERKGGKGGKGTMMYTTEEEEEEEGGASPLLPRLIHPSRRRRRRREGIAAVPPGKETERKKGSGAKIEVRKREREVDISGEGEGKSGTRLLFAHLPRMRERFRRFSVITAQGIVWVG